LRTVDSSCRNWNSTMARQARHAEIKIRTTSEIRSGAAEVFSRWGLSLTGAINIFLIKSIEVGGLPFDLRPEAPSYNAIAARAYKAPFNDDGIPVLPAEWDEIEAEQILLTHLDSGRRMAEAQGTLTTGQVRAAFDEIGK